VGVDGDGECGAAGVFGVRDHLGEVEGFGAWGEKGRADDAGGVPDYEGHFLSGYVFAGDYDVGFVLTRGVV
jgi:hypothetical protein